MEQFKSVSPVADGEMGAGHAVGRQRYYLKVYRLQDYLTEGTVEVCTNLELMDLSRRAGSQA